MTSVFIVIPTLNSYRLLPALVQSLVEQSHSQWRVLFVDGPSHTKHREWLDTICSQDKRFRWVRQTDPHSGIFGAMNQGFSFAHPHHDWLLFWGSDDRAASPQVFEKAIDRLTRLEQNNTSPHLYICESQYFSNRSFSEDSSLISLKRSSRFYYYQSFKRSLFFGSSPPHQATFFGPKARRLLHQYTLDLRIAADLDYFLRLSNTSRIDIVVDSYKLVLMGDSGVSAQKNRQRLKEVVVAYKRAYGLNWWIPFMLRYIQRVYSVLDS